MRQPIGLLALLLCVPACGSPGAASSDEGASPPGPLSSGFEREPNDRAAEANELTPKAWIQGGVGGTRDRADRFAFVFPVDGELTLRIENLAAGEERSRLAGPTLEDAAGHLVVRLRDDVTSGQTGEIVASVSAGIRYVLTVEARDGGNTPYMLKSSFSGG